MEKENGKKTMQLFSQKYLPTENIFLEKNKVLTSVCIILPCYNERENIREMLKKIFSEEEKEKNLFIRYYVLVVDDNSPDGTSKEVLDYAKENKRVTLLMRFEKNGLGSAYIDGMKEALKKIRPDIILQMDADGQHNPEDIPRLIQPIIEDKADYVIGSRYVSGGSIEGSWGAHRKMISFLARSFVRIGLGLKEIQDCSGGYKAIHSSVLLTIDLDSLKEISKGFGFQAALLEATYNANFRIKEVPITFNQRMHGTSKMRFQDMIEGLKIIYKIRLKRLSEKVLNNK